MKDMRISGENAAIIIANAISMTGRKWHGSYLWSFVSQLTGHGSGYSIEICKSANLVPDQIIGKYALKTIK